MVKRPKFIRVRRYDHHEADETWAEPKTIETLKASRVESRGWLLVENDECIELSAHRPLDRDDASWGRLMRRYDRLLQRERSQSLRVAPGTDRQQTNCARRRRRT